MDEKLGELHWRTQEQQIGTQVETVLMGKFQGFERAQDMKISANHGEFLAVVEQKMKQVEQHVVTKVEHEKQRIQGELSQLLNNFILHCQQGGETVRTLAGVQKELLNVEIQAQIQAKSEDLEIKVKDFLQKQSEEFQRKDTMLTAKVSKFEEPLGQINTFLSGFAEWWKKAKEEIISTFTQSPLMEIQMAKWETEADLKFQGKLQATMESWLGKADDHINRECAGLKESIRQRFEKIQNFLEQSKIAAQQVEAKQILQHVRLDKLQTLLEKSQGLPFEKIMELMNKSEDNIRTQVRTEMDLQGRRNMEIMMTKMLEERFKQTQREGNLEEVRKTIEASFQQKLTSILDRVGEDFRVERIARQKLESELEKVRANKLQNQVGMETFVAPREETIFQAPARRVPPPPVIRPGPPEEVETFSLHDEPYHNRPNVFFEEIETFSLCSEPFQEPRRETRQIRPVHVEGAPTVIPISGQLSQYVMKNVVMPKFSGKTYDWRQFREDWEYYLRKVSSTNAVNDPLKMALLEGCLDEVNQKQLRHEGNKSKTPLKYSEVISKLEVKYGQDQGLSLRKKWQDVSLPTAGRVTCQEWEEFRVNFQIAFDNVKDASPGEARRLLMQKVPVFIYSWIVEEEDRRRTLKPTVKINVPFDFSETNVSASLKKIAKVEPTKVTKVGEGLFEIVVSDQSELVNLQALTGKFFNLSNEMIRVEEKITAMDMDDLFAFVNRKLALRDNQEMLRGYHGKSPENERRNVRATSVEPRSRNSSNPPETESGNHFRTKTLPDPQPPSPRRSSLSPRRSPGGRGAQKTTSSSQTETVQTPEEYPASKGTKGGGGNPLGRSPIGSKGMNLIGETNGMVVEIGTPPKETRDVERVGTRVGRKRGKARVRRGQHLHRQRPVPIRDAGVKWRWGRLP